MLGNISTDRLTAAIGHPCPQGAGKGQSRNRTRGITLGGIASWVANQPAKRLSGEMKPVGRSVAAPESG
jgi:hypothetical protein